MVLADLNTSASPLTQQFLVNNAFPKMRDIGLLLGRRGCLTEQLMVLDSRVN